MYVVGFAESLSNLLETVSVSPACTMQLDPSPNQSYVGGIRTVLSRLLDQKTGTFVSLALWFAQ